MNFLESIFHRLRQAPAGLLLQEVRDGGLQRTSCGEFLAMVSAARAFLVQSGLRKGDRCALLAPNSIRWAALDLALMAEGIVVVPLYARQAPAELGAMMRDSSPRLVCCGDAALRDAVPQNGSDAPRFALLDEIFCQAGEAPPTAAATTPVPRSVADNPVSLTDDDPLAIIYTSGTSGEPKGAILSVGNLNHMLPSTNARLDALMGSRIEQERVFHYLPFCFAGSWIVLLTCLSRAALLTLSTDLSRLSEEMKLAAPDYFLNVPALLERMRVSVEDQLAKRGGIAAKIFGRARTAWFRRRAGTSTFSDHLWLALASATVFRTIRKKLGPGLRALICGSAPLATETQLFFMMLGLPVLQVYGLTETTAICTVDHPYRIEPGRVGQAIPGIEMKLGENDEILVRGPNIFSGYWSRPDETAKVLRDGWFHTGDQGEVDSTGNWRIIGRLKNLIILSSGHNIAPEPIEETLLRSLPGAQHVMLIGNGCSFPAALITGSVARNAAEAALARLNAEMPHYKRIHSFRILEEPFTIENGLLTANGKLKRDAIAARFAAEIEGLYSKRTA